MSNRSSGSNFPALSLPVRALILAAAVTQFFIGHGPIWKRGVNWDYSILYSYVTIPILVGVALGIKKRLAWIPWWLHSLEIAGVKFGITAGFLLMLLIIRGGPGFETQPSPARAVAVIPQPPEIQEVRTLRIRGPVPGGGTVVGEIQEESGRPVEGALGYITDDVQGELTEMAVEPLVIKIGGQGFKPPLSIGFSGQSVRFLSEDRRLHTTRATWTDRGWEFNVAVPPNGPVPVHWRHSGLAELHCTVHGRAEPGGYLLLSPHAFHARSDASGTLTIAGLPEGEYTLQTWAPQYKTLSTRVSVRGGAVTHQSVRLTRSVR